MQASTSACVNTWLALLFEVLIVCINCKSSSSLFDLSKCPTCILELKWTSNKKNIYSLQQKICLRFAVFYYCVFVRFEWAFFVLRPQQPKNRVRRLNESLCKQTHKIKANTRFYSLCWKFALVVFVSSIFSIGVYMLIKKSVLASMNSFGS